MGDDVRLYSKRIDSTLRGNLGGETDAMLDCLGKDFIAVSAPCFPSSGRTLVGGYLLVDDLPLHKTNIAIDPKTPVKTSDMARLFLWIMRHSPVPALSREEVGAEDDRVRRRALEYIGERFLFDISLAEVADYCGMGYTAFSRLFTRSMQVSFPDYVQRRRLEHADILLATTDKRVTEVAMEAGFSSVSYFIYCFRKLRGVTPTRFRRDFASPAGQAGTALKN